MLSSRRIFGRRRPWGLLFLLCLAGLIFCTVPAPAVGAAGLKAQLVNKIIEDTGPVGFPTGEVQLTFPDGRTQFLPYRSHFPPLVANGKVYIFLTEYGKLTSIVIYDPAKGWGQSFPLPDDLDPYSGCPSFSPDGTKVAYYFFPDNKHGYIDRTGKVVIPMQSYDMVDKFSEGLARVVVKGRHGFIDTTGKLVIPPQFDGAGDFSEGLAMVAVRDNFGFIDRTGKIVIELTYESAFNFSEGLAWVKRGEWQGFIDRQGKEVIWKHHKLIQGFSEGMVAAEFVRKWGFLDKSGEVAITPQFDLAQNFSEGLAMVMKNNKCGFIDHTGKIAIPLKYDNAYAFSEGLAAVLIGEKWGFIDKAGKVVITPQFDHVNSQFQDGLARVYVRLNNKEEFIDKTGKLVTPPWTFVTKQHLHFSQGLARVRLKGKYGFIDITGKLVIPPQFDGAQAFSEGLAAIRMGEEGCGRVRVRSWPDWRLLWESPVYKWDVTDVPPDPPVWKSKSPVEVDLHIFYPPETLSVRIQEKEGDGK